MRTVLSKPLHRRADGCFLKLCDDFKKPIMQFYAEVIDSFQVEHLVAHSRGFLQVTRQVAKTSVSYESSSKSQTSSSSPKRALGRFKSEAFPIPAPQNSTSTHQSHCHSDIHLHQTSRDSWCLPRKFNFDTSNTYTKSDDMTSSCLQQSLHHTTRLK